MTEDQFYRSLFPRLHWDDREVAVPPGDDCAALRGSSGELLLLAVDQLVGNRHYRADGADADPPRAAGRKLLARNLSDIAAMGGTPAWALVAMALGPRRDSAWVDGFMDGMLELGREFGVSVLGGDMARAPADDVASLTILGRVQENEVVRRGGARPGDCLFATGCFGASLPSGHHLSFTPRCREGRWLAAQGYPTAMIDVSDGLLLDAGRLADASGVTVELHAERVPLRVATRPREQALTDGEDYELLFSVAGEGAAELSEQWPFPELPLTRIGEAAPRGRHSVTDENGRAFACTRHGFDHFVNS